jgi:hypothetical protein
MAVDGGWLVGAINGVEPVVSLGWQRMGKSQSVKASANRAQFWQVRKDIRSLPATIRNDETVMGVYGRP